jgi:hypothetical protein
MREGEQALDGGEPPIPRPLPIRACRQSVRKALKIAKARRPQRLVDQTPQEPPGVTVGRLGMRTPTVKPEFDQSLIGFGLGQRRDRRRIRNDEGLAHKDLNATFQ